MYTEGIGYELEVLRWISNTVYSVALSLLFIEGNVDGDEKQLKLCTFFSRRNSSLWALSDV